MKMPVITAMTKQHLFNGLSNCTNFGLYIRFKKILVKSILVTGGTTFVSKYVAEYFVNVGYEVYVLNRNSKSQVKDVNLITGDRHNLGDILKDMHFDIVADITAYDAKDIIDLYNALGSNVANEAAVNKKPYFDYIDKNLA